MKLPRAAPVEDPMPLHPFRPHFLRIALAALIGVSVAGVGVLALADPPKAGHAPDPAVRASKTQWVFDISHKNGKNKVNRVRSVTLEHAVSTARVTGRYAIELYIGKQLLDRVRFNVPLTGDGPSERSHRRVFSRPTFENVSTRLRVQITDNPRATYVMLVDRATGESQRFWWPPGPDGALVPMATPAETTASPAPKAPPVGAPEPESTSSTSPEPASVDAGKAGPAASGAPPAERAAPPAAKPRSK